MPVDSELVKLKRDVQNLLEALRAVRPGTRAVLGERERLRLKSEIEQLIQQLDEARGQL